VRELDAAGLNVYHVIAPYLLTFVAANQRERILSAVAQAASELGYAEMSVQAIIARAGVSRRTFYEHSKNKEDAFLAAYDAVVHQQARNIRRAYLINQGTVRERLRAGPRRGRARGEILPGAG